MTYERHKGSIYAILRRLDLVLLVCHAPQGMLMLCRHIKAGVKVFPAMMHAHCFRWAFPIVAQAHSLIAILLLCRSTCMCIRP